MTDKRPWITYPQLMDRLRRLREERRTGTLFCVTQDNSSAVITLQRGTIVSLSFSTIPGIAALPRIGTITRCKVSFKNRFIFRIDHNLPGDSELFQLLEAGQSITTPAGSVLLLNGNGLKNVIKREIRALLGPAAERACERRFTAGNKLQTRDDLRQFLRMIAAETQKTGLTGRLIEKVMGKLGVDERVYPRI